MARVLVAAIFLLAAAALPAQNNGVIEGRLVSNLGRVGISGVAVTLTEVDSATAYNAITDTAGAFRFPALPGGEYALKYTAEDYLELPPYHPAKRMIKVVPEGDPIHLDVMLFALGRLKGRVVDSDGRPLANARIELREFHGEDEHTEISGADGSFEIASLSPGTYTLMADSAAEPPAGAAANTAWAPTYYPNRLELQDAEPIVMRSGARLSGFEIRVRTVTMHKVRGHVAGPEGKPIPGATVKVMTRRPGAPIEGQTTANSDGDFELTLRRGAWFLTSEPEEEGTPYGVASVTVAESDVEDVRIRVARRFTMTGVVQGELPQSPVYLAPAGWTVGQIRGARVDRDGTMRIENVIPGRYRVVLRMVPPPTYLESIYLGEQDVLGGDIELYEGVPPLRIVFRADSPTVRGTVANGRNAAVVLVPQDESLPAEVLTRFAGTDGSGHFDITGLRPGSYYAFAFDYIGQWRAVFDPNFVRPLLPQAARVEVRKRETASLDLKVTPWPD